MKAIVGQAGSLRAIGNRPVQVPYGRSVFLSTVSNARSQKIARKERRHKKAGEANLKLTVYS